MADVRQLGAVQTGQAGTRPAQHGQGQWHYVPNELVSPAAPAPQPQPGSPAANNDGTTAPRRRRRNRRPRGGPPSGDGASDRSEQAESETLTYDPTVSARESSATARRARQHDLTETDRQEYDFPVPLKPPFLDEPTNPLCATTAKRSFPPRMGPKKHVRWLGGAPPSPPVWRYDSADLRTFSKWARKASPLLYNSLTGEAARGNRLLERAQLTPADQRLILVGLFSDSHALATAPTTDTAASAEIVRSEAVKTIADLNVKHYWRWRKRGIKKRGGWVTAKFLSWDPSSPGKLAWVRSGTSTALVAIEQLRAATGFEAWVPTEEEVQMLKDAAKSLDQSIWTDETGPPPPKRQLDEDEVDFDTESSTPRPQRSLPLRPPCQRHPQQRRRFNYNKASSPSQFGTTNSKSRLGTENAKTAAEEQQALPPGPSDPPVPVPPTPLEIGMESAQNESADSADIPGQEDEPPVPQAHQEVPVESAANTEEDPAPPVPQAPVPRSISSGFGAPTTPVTSQPSWTHEPVDNLLPAKRPFDALTTSYYEGGNLRHCGSGHKEETYYQAYLTSEHRKKILDMPEKDIEAFKAATIKEVKSWVEWDNAPRLWALTVIARLKEIGYHQHSFDKMVFLKYLDGQLVSIIIVYVTQAFRWGILQEFALEQTVTFKGKQLTLRAKNNGRVYLHVCQKEFIDGMDPGKVPRGSDLQKLLTPDQKAEFRSIAGCLQWISGQCRPELAAANSLANHGNQTTLGDLRDLYQAVDFARETRDDGFVIPDVPISKATVILAYSDASWANAEQSRSQCGVLIVLCSTAVLQKTVPAMVVDWKSCRSQRVCRSTLAAESCAADEACDRSAYISMFLGEILYDEAPAHRVGAQLHNLAATDAKSLYDVVVSDSPNLSDKRSLVNIRAIQEVVSGERFHWIPTTLMWADALTKQSVELQCTMHEWLQNPTATLKK
ncbi:UCK2 [Symbiodinium necroappetens]|uniref:UCK2 protein n=1 Tax=Symbiodinium necroappetens TaxID=1628268 RepID=A0A812TS06_9DINO|nr:UCK2 [Symbiodinium necroappetens]